jgi:Helix-turn-helix.
MLTTTNQRLGSIENDCLVVLGGSLWDGGIMAPARDLDPDASPLHLFGFELRRYRTEAGLTQEQLGRKIQYTKSFVGMVENATRNPKRDFAVRCDEALGLNGPLARLWDNANRNQPPAWFRPWLELEQSAAALRTWQPLIVPGLLQTEDYARAIISGAPGATPEQIEQRLASRLTRQGILTRDKPPMMTAILDEGVLNRPIGSPAVTRAQMEHLVELAETVYVTIQVVPYSVYSTSGLLGGFIIAHVPGSPDAVYLESAGTAHVTDQPDEVASVTIRYDAIRAEAHPRKVSLELIKETLKQWT